SVPRAAESVRTGCRFLPVRDILKGGAPGRQLPRSRRQGPMTMTKPRLLILETSGRIGQVALAEGGEILSRRRLDEARRHARDLAPTLAEQLAAQGWRARDLNGIVGSRGPGSYTGLRVGIMSAKALAYATGCALLAVDTFTAIALQAPEAASRVEVVADAQQGRVYAQRFIHTPAGTGLAAGSPLTVEL